MPSECPCCHQPTPEWELDAFNGLCGICDKIKWDLTEEAKLIGEAPTRKDKQ